MATKHTHTKDCTDHKDAAADRKARAAVSLVDRRQQHLQILAHSEWLDLFAPKPRPHPARIEPAVDQPPDPDQ
jgi:hypothetical protein